MLLYDPAYRTKALYECLTKDSVGSAGPVERFLDPLFIVATI